MTLHELARFLRSLRGALNRRTLSFRLIVLMLSTTGMIFIVAFAYNYVATSAIMLEDATINARHLAQSVIGRIAAHSDTIQKLTKSIAAQLGARQDLPWLYTTQRQLVENNNDIFGTCAAFEPFSADPGRRHFAPYHFKRDGSVSLKVLGGTGYDYFAMPWYAHPKETGQPCWTGPYYDEGGGNVLMATYSVPFYRTVNGAQRFAGVVTVDISIDWLSDYLNGIRLFESGYAFLIMRDGTFITHPDRRLVSRENMFTRIAQSGDPSLARIIKRMDVEPFGAAFGRDFHTGKRSLHYVHSLAATGWIIVIVVPEHELYGDLRSLARTIVLIIIVGMLALFVAVLFVARSITRPVHSLSRVAGEIAHGNLDIDVPHADIANEIGMLAESFRSMKLSLREYIANLRETTAAKERIESELAVGRTIQMSFIPAPPRPADRREEYEIAAAIEMAREVGGDLYDIVPLDEDRLFLLVGDVSGKGVPAALLMAVTRTLFRAFATSYRRPAALLERVNEELARENDSAMFVTAFCGVYNCATGELAYSNAGHNPPLFMGADGDIRPLALPFGIALGADDGAAFGDAIIAMRPGERILVYTDGVTEALNECGEFFGEPGLIRALARAHSASAEETVARAIAAVREHAGGAPQSDDITLLCLRALRITTSADA